MVRKRAPKSAKAPYFCGIGFRRRCRPQRLERATIWLSVTSCHFTCAQDSPFVPITVRPRDERTQSHDQHGLYGLSRLGTLVVQTAIGLDESLRERWYFPNAHKSHFCVAMYCYIPTEPRLVFCASICILTTLYFTKISRTFVPHTITDSQNLYKRDLTLQPWHIWSVC